MSKLLSMKEPITDNKKEPKRDPAVLSKRLQLHVIATCFPKMLRRFKQPASRLFIESLESVKAWEFDEDKRGQPSKKEIGNDREFVADYLLPTEWRALVGEIPNLINQAKLVGDKTKTVERLYTQETCMEFHKVLIYVIKDFMNSLNALQGAKPNALTRGTEDFKKKVLRAAVSGYMLQKLTKGAAIKMHLNTIAPLLKSWNDCHSQTSMSTQGPIENSEERDEDIEAVCESVKKGDSLATSYLDWLRLLVTHFDAISVLVGYVTGPEFNCEAISIEIVVAPRVEPILLPWRTLFSDATLFPITTPLDFPLTGTTTNAAILKFLNQALETLPQFKVARDAWSRGDKDATIRCFEKLMTSKVKSWVKCAERMLAMLSNDSFSDDITTEIQSMCKSTAFFDALAADKGFSGTLHCEACLASLLAKDSLASKEILARMKVSQVSDLFLSPESHFL